MSLQYALLGLLTYSPMNGYKLKKIFDKSINYTWTANLSQIYRELGSLQKKGYVSSSVLEQEDRPDKKIYEITEDGTKAFNEWLMNFPESFPWPKRDEFMLRMFFGASVGKEELVKQLKKFILEKEKFNLEMQDTEKAILQMKKAIDENSSLQATDGNELYWSFITKRAHMSNEVLITWAKECIKELEENMD